MRLECAAAIAPGSDPRVEDLALQLLTLAGDQSVRTVEALAAVLTNQEDDGMWSAKDAPAISLARDAFTWQEAARTEPIGKLSLCRRVARRALCRSLLDPTGGANAFHRIDASPDWARRLLPVASYGSFLFYRL